MTAFPKWSSDPAVLEAEIIERAVRPPLDWYAGLDPGAKRAAAALVPGSVDLHVHADPSPCRRHGDTFYVAREAARAGMRAIVVKEHHCDMSEAAWLTRDHADLPADFDIFGSVWLNNHVGGWNPYAVDKALLFGARLIGGPTVASYGQLVTMAEAHGDVHPADVLVKTRAPRAPRVVYTLGDDGKCLPEVVECVDVIAKDGTAILATGHLDRREAESLVRMAHARGVERICMTHATHSGASWDQLQALCADTGAVCELIWTEIRSLGEDGADVLRRIGLDHITLSTDSGFYLTPELVETYTYSLAALLKCGLTEDEVARVAHDTPSRLLSLTETTKK